MNTKAHHHETREQWLETAISGHISAHFLAAGYPLPEQLRVSVGFPAKGGLREKNMAIGQCWTSKASADGHFEVFISPVLDDAARVLDVLVHECVHASVGTECGHKGPFKKCAKAVGLEGKMTATVAGPELAEATKQWAVKLGEYPHARLSPERGDRRKQTTRLLKVTCPGCGYTVRVTAKWLEVGLPFCCCGNEMQPDAE